MKTLIIIVLLILSTNTTAEDKVSFLFGGWSKHYIQEDTTNFNESHNLIGIEYHNWVLFTYNNTYYNQSTFVGYKFPLWKKSNFTFNGTVGLVDGYTKEQSQDAYMGHGLTLYAAPSISYLYPINDKLSFGTDIALVFVGNGVIAFSSLQLVYKF